MGKYLYGFAEGEFGVPGELRGLADASVATLRFEDVAAVVSDHGWETLPLLRRNLEPHHRVVRELSSRATLVPATFGHIAEGEEQMIELLRANRAAIRAELDRLAGKTEMGLKLRWDLDNIFEYMVGVDRDLRRRRDRVFGKSRVTMQEKLDLGAFFEERLARERERLGGLILEALEPVACETREHPPGEEKTVLDAALLIERARQTEFEQAVYRSASLFDSHFALDYNGPWPPYNFVRLALEMPAAAAA